MFEDGGMLFELNDDNEVHKGVPSLRLVGAIRGG